MREQGRAAHRKQRQHILIMDKTEKKQLPLRLSPVLWDEINRWAADEFRSVNGQIEYLLSEAVRKRQRANKDAEAGEAI